jgi:endonuclease/exonuclease/phosphatase family metal-dependent hydrolase
MSDPGGIGMEATTPVATSLAGGAGRRLKLLSYNVQAGLPVGRYREYLTRGWQYLLPLPDRWDNLERIAGLARDFDLVALQETDPGSLRSGFLSQTEYLARVSGFPYWCEQENRRLGSLTRHSNGLLSRLEPLAVEDHKLPGRKGRGMIAAHFGDGLTVFVLHLALGRVSRALQLEHLAQEVNRCRHAIVMGDLNCEAGSPELRALMLATRLRPAGYAGGTFPSWRPTRAIDHILLTPQIRVERTYLPPLLLSDHLPVATDVVVPASDGA